MTVGLATIKYSNQIPRGYILPDGTVTRNQITAQLAAEKENERLKKAILPAPWEGYEVAFIIESGRRYGIKTIAEKLDRNPQDVRRMIEALKGGAT